MDEYGRRQRERERERERERNERQQIQSANHENSLFSEPRRAIPSEDDDHITAKLGEYSTVKEYINNYIVGFANSGHRQSQSNAILPGIMPTSASTPTLYSSSSSSQAGYAGSAAAGAAASSSSSSQQQQQRLSLPPPSQQQQQQPLAPPPHHYQQQQQQSRQPPYLKQADNKPPYNGRGGYPGQPIKNDLRSSGMAPPRGPPLSSSVSSSLTSSLPAAVTASNATSSQSQSQMMQSTTPSTTLMPNGRQSASEKSFLGPPTTTPSTTHNGRFPQPSIPKSRFKQLPPERDVKEILNIMDTFCVPSAPLTQIAATPHTTITENYNLNAPNKFKYAFDPLGSSSAPMTPLTDPITPLMPLRDTTSSASALAPIQPLLSPPTSLLPPPAAPPALNSSSTAATSLHLLGQGGGNSATTTMTTTATMSAMGQQPAKSVISAASTATAAAVAASSAPTAIMRPKESPILKPLKTEKITPMLEKQNSTLENDLELSESDDDRKKQNHSALNSSESSQSDSSESGSEDSSKGEHQPLNTHNQQAQQQTQQLLHLSAQQQQQSATLRPSTTTSGSSSLAAVTAATASKKKPNSQTITASGGNTISGLLSSSVLGSAGSSCSGPSSTSSSNKTPSPSDSNKWNLSNYFKSHPTQNGAPPTATTTLVNSMKVNMNAPTLLPGGAQIIPEPMPAVVVVPQPSPSTAIVKNEAIADDDEDEDDDDEDDNDDDDDSDEEEEEEQLTAAAAVGSPAFRHPGAFAARKPPQGLSVTSMAAPPAVLEIKKEAADSLFSSSAVMLKAGANVVNSSAQVPMLNDADFVAIPKSQIKHEASASSSSLAMTDANALLTITSLRGVHSPKTKVSPPVAVDMKSHHHGVNYAPIEGFSGLSSDSNSSDAGGNSPAARRHHQHTQQLQQQHRHHHPMPIVNPDGTLLIPGVPAAITALPRSPPMLSKTSLHQKPPMPPNTLTVTPIDPLPASPKSLQQQQQRAKKPRKKMKTPAQLPPACDSSDEDESVGVNSSANVSAAALRGKLHIEQTLTNSGASAAAAAAIATTNTAAKKGRGRPRKNTPNQSGNLSSASASSNTKGPTLTAKKDVLSSGSSSATANISASNSAVKKSSIARRRTSRQNSSSTTSSAQDITPTKNAVSASKSHTTAATLPPALPHKLQAAKNAAVAAMLNDNDGSSEDSSSSSSSSDSTSKTSSSSDSEASSDADEVVRAGSVASSSEESLHKRQAAVAAAAAHTAAGRRIVKQLNKRKSSLDDIPALAKNVASTHATAALAKKGRTATQIPQHHHTSSSSEDSSAEDYVTHATNDFATVGGGAATVGSGGSSHRSQNQQSPYKATVSSSRSRVLTSCSSSSSSDDEQSDIDDGVRKEKKLRRDKPKSDKNKISTLTRIFNPKEGGAKKQGQVVIIDQSEELLAKEQHQLQQQQLHHQQQQKHISPNAAFRTSQENLAAQFSNASSPRLTPGHHHMKSPRNPPLPPSQLSAISSSSAVTTTSGHRRTPDHSRSSAERKTKRLRTPPTRTPTPTQQQTTLASPARALLAHNVTSTPPRPLTQQSAAQSLICRIDLSRLRIAPEWHKNSFRIGGGHTPVVGAGPPTAAGRTPIYDHETILNADLQATQKNRLKSSGSGSTGSRTPTQPALLNNAHAERVLSRSQESLFDGSVGKQRLEDMHTNAARMSSRSADGGSTPKDLHAALPNGYAQRAIAAGGVRGGSASPSTKLMTAAGVKHEHIKYEPDLDATAAYCNAAETKFKASSGAGGVKQELILKHDYKPSELSDKHHMDGASGVGRVASPLLAEAKPRRKRSSSASSSPYKEKKRKKDKDSAGKDTEKHNMGKDGASGDDIMYGNNGQTQKELLLHEHTQLPPTNHDRLVMGKQTPPVAVVAAQQHNNAKHHIMSNTSSSPAHLRNSSSSNATTAQSMPPPPPSTAAANVAMHQQQQQLQQHDASSVRIQSPSMQQQQQQSNAAPQLVYRSYFERDDFSGDLRHRHQKFIDEAVSRKHAADREQNSFNQVTLYLEAVVYFILSGAAMEQSRNSDSAFKMNKETLELIKFISKKFLHLQVPPPIINKVHVLSLRCQSLISLKLYKIKRPLCIYISGECNEFFRSGRGDIVNGNTPSSVSSPSNSIGSQGSGSNTPPGKMVPQHIHSCLQQQNEYFGYLTACHDLWDQADRLVQDNLTDFFIALDRENGPLTLHSSMYEVFRYVQAGLKKLKDAMSTQS